MNARDTLSDNLHRLTASDRVFAESLLSSLILSEEQLHWLNKLADRARPRETLHVENVETIFTLFEHAQQTRAKPAITFRCEFPITLRLRNGKLRVTNAYHGNHDRIDYGTIDRDGTYTPVSRHGPRVQAVVNAIARDPAAAARSHGIRYGKCCFCGLKLTNEERSVAWGYGPVCARNWNLPWDKIGVKGEHTPWKLGELPPSWNEEPFDQLNTEPEPAKPVPTRMVTFRYRPIGAETDGYVSLEVPIDCLVLIEEPADLRQFCKEYDIRYDATVEKRQVMYRSPSGRKRTCEWRIRFFHCDETDMVSLKICFPQAFA